MFREVRVDEIKEVLRLWLRGEGLRSIERLSSWWTFWRPLHPAQNCGISVIESAGCSVIHITMASIRAKVRDRTPRGYAGRDLAFRCRRAQPRAEGWGECYRYGNSSRKFNAVDSDVHERLAKLASVKHGLSGRNWTTRFTYGWLTNLGFTG